MISRDEAIQKLKVYWEVSEFTFLARFDVPISQQETDEPNAYGFFKEIYWNKKRLFFPSEEDNLKRNSASCYAKKEGLKHNSYYIITAELSPDDKRKKNQYALTLTQAREATQEEIDEHRSNFERKETVYLAYVNFVAFDKSHAYVKIIDEFFPWKIKKASGEKGVVLNELPNQIKKGQLVIVKKIGAKQKVTFVSDVFKGRLFNKTSFIDIDTFSSPLGIMVTSTNGFTKTELESCNNHLPCTVKIFDSDNGFAIEKFFSEKALNLSDLEIFFDKELNDLIFSDKRDNEFKNLTFFYQKIYKDFKQKLDEIILNRWEEIADRFNEKEIIEFLSKWSKKYPEFVRFSNFRGFKYPSLLMKLWQENLLPVYFFEDEILDIFINYINNQQIGPTDFLEGLHPNGLVLLKTKYLEILANPIVIESVEVFSIFEILLHYFSLTEDQKKNIFSILQASVTKQVQFELWKNNRLEIFPLDFAIGEFFQLDSQKQMQVILQLSDEELAPLLGQIKPSENDYVNERIENLNQKFIFKKLDFLVFDIESDTKKISEIAWTTGDEIHGYKGADIETGITLLKKELEKGFIIIGHNVLDFDLPILNKIVGITFDSSLVWDTLQVEKMLSPELKTFALNGPHHAEGDVKINLQLFKNQFFRILKKIDTKPQIVEGILPDKVKSRLVSLGKNFQFNTSLDSLNETKLQYYRPQPKTNPLVEELRNKVSQSEIEEKVILGDESLIADVMSYAKVTFSEKFAKKLEFQILNILHVQNSAILSDALKGQLLSYYLFCQEHELIPYWGNISPSIRIEIEGEMDVWTLFNDKSNHQYSSIYPRFILASDLSTLEGNLSETQLFVVQPDLISISQKQLLKQVELEQLKAMFQDNFFWMKFSGGQSVVSMSKLEVQKLVADNIDDFDSFWIEKYQFGKYRIYANANWEQVVSKIPFKEISKIDLDPDQFKSDQVVSIKLKSDNSEEYNVTRFNPESIYRSRYWVIQKKIIDQLVLKGDSILLIQRPEEIEILTKYFESDGYYIPKIEIGLGRRIELLHKNSNRNKLIISHLSEVYNILKWNHSFPINLIVDSFNLNDTFYCAKGTSFFNEYIKEGTYKKEEDLNVFSDEEDSENLDVTSSINSDNFLKDYVFLLKLLRPHITNLRNLLFLNNQDNMMILLDPRIEDYTELCKQWNITKQYVQGWNKKEDFEKEVLRSEGFITSPKPIEIPFTEEETIEIIRRVFIGKNPWKEEQLPYLKEILSTQDDWLVSLPTGGGKSVLFQGPALFKSAFTNRLTIVITPLKALMEDHVNTLWEKGFFGCVDYLNADRSSDTELIYRSIAGGEMSLLFVTPERFRSKRFLNAIDSRIQSDGGLEYFVFDEAHCVSQWGNDFRPDYFNCAKMVWRTKSVSSYSTPILLFSATVTKQTYQDFNAIFS